MAIWKLTIEDDDGQKTVVPLTRDVYTFGRREGHTIRLTERNVSRDHARLRRDQDNWILEDLGSSNGVLVNGKRMAVAHTLRPGDLVLIGDYRLESLTDDIVAVAEAQPSKPAVEQQYAFAPQSDPTPIGVADRPHRLVLLSGADGGREHPLETPRVLVGRGDDVDVRLTHSSVSRHHCEILIVEAGVFELRDLGSANGVRVNGHEVRRHRISDGDILELGDIRLRFVGAGQAYVFDEAERAAEAQRTRRRGIGPRLWISALASVVAAAAVGVLMAKNKDRTPTSVASGHNTVSYVATAPSREDPFATACRLHKEGDVAAAHAQLRAAPHDSPRRGDECSTAIENAWADGVLRRAETETDPTAKRSALMDVATSTADESYRTRASALLAEMDQARGRKAGDTAVGATGATHRTADRTRTSAMTGAEPPAVSTAATSTVGALGATGSSGASGGSAATTSGSDTSGRSRAASGAVEGKPRSSSSTKAEGAAGNCPSWRGDFRAAMKSKDFECVRTILWPRLQSNAITSDEARYLKAACNALQDNACQKRAAEKL